MKTYQLFVVFLIALCAIASCQNNKPNISSPAATQFTINSQDDYNAILDSEEFNPSEPVPCNVSLEAVAEICNLSGRSLDLSTILMGKDMYADAVPTDHINSFYATLYPPNPPAEWICTKTIEDAEGHNDLTIVVSKFVSSEEAAKDYALIRNQISSYPNSDVKAMIAEESIDEQKIRLFRENIGLGQSSLLAVPENQLMLLYPLFNKNIIRFNIANGAFISFVKGESQVLAYMHNYPEEYASATICTHDQLIKVAKLVDERIS